MAATNVNITNEVPLFDGAANNEGLKAVYIPSTTKAAQNDTITLKRASSIVHAELQIVATGAHETNTISSNVITLTSATTGAVRGVIYYK